MQTTVINSFRTISDDSRLQQNGLLTYVKNFDAYTSSRTLTPINGTEAEGGSISVYGIGAVAPVTASNGTEYLMAIGHPSGNTRVQFLEKSGDFITSNFTTSTSGAGTVNGVITAHIASYFGKSYVYREDTGVAKIASYDRATNTLVETVGTIGGSSASLYPPPFVHPKNKKIFFASGNTIASYDNSSFTGTAFTLQSNLVVTSFCDYGDLLAIAAVTKGSNPRSYLILWDMASTTVISTYDAGDGALKVLDNAFGPLIGISSPSLNGSGTSFEQTGRIVFREFNGSRMNVIKEVVSESTTAQLLNVKGRVRSSIVFCASVKANGTTQEPMLWVCGKDANGLYVLPERTANNDIAASSIDTFSIIGSFAWIAYNGDGSLSRSEDSSTTFDCTAIYESQRFNGDSSVKKKQLWSVGVGFAPLPTAGQVVLKYRVDSDTSWTTIFTETTDNAISREATLDASGNNLPSSYKEIQFRIESTGGASITELRFKWDYIDNQT